MAFYDDSWVQVEALIDGSWENLTTDFDDNDDGGRISGGDGVTISRGKSVGAQRANTSECKFTIFNRDGKYSNRNPRSPYFGLLPLNVPVRVKALPYESHVVMESDSTERDVYALDTAALDITGDLELRIDLELEHVGDNAHDYVIVSKYSQLSNRSWLLYYSGNTGVLSFYWTTDGLSGTLRNLFSNAPLPSGRRTIRLMFDVDNGAGGVTATWYTGTSIDGPFTQLGTPATAATTTSIFSGNADVLFGRASSGGFGIAGPYTKPLRGKLYGFRLYNGLTGTLSASADFTQLDPGATAVTTGGITWQIESPAYVASDRIRFYGFIPRWPIEQDTTGQHVYSGITAYGKWQVLNNGATALDSPMFRYYSSLTACRGYWPCEDGSTATVLSAATPGVAPARYTGIELARNGDLPGSAPLMVIDENSFARGIFPTHAQTGAIAFTFAFYLSEEPVNDNTIIVFGTSTNYSCQFRVGAGNYQTRIFDPSGTDVSNNVTSYGTGAEPGQWIIIVIEMEQSGGNITWTTNWRTTDPSLGYAHGGTVTTASLGRITAWNVPGLAAASGITECAIGHIAGSTSVDDYLELAHITSFRGYVGETEMARLARLADEFGINITIRGNTDRGTPMGAQGLKTLVALLDECADAGQGILYESRYSDGLIYLGRDEIENYHPVELAHTDVLSDATATDDLIPVNSVTVTREGGGSSTTTTTYGPKKIELIGLYDDPRTLSLQTDDQTRHLANFIRVIGSWDEMRWALLEVNRARDPFVSDASLDNSILGLDIGSSTRVTDPPDYLPIREAEGLLENYTETLKRFEHTIVMETTPITPYSVASTNDKRTKIGSNSSVLAAAVSSTSATTITVECNDDLCKWEFSTEFDIAVGSELAPEKERMTVTNITGTASPYTFTVTRGTPASTHPDASTVRLWDQRRIAY